MPNHRRSGIVVTPAQLLMTIVPLESHLEIEAMVSNRDIGFIEAGQEGAIKVATFNFTRYGLLHGKVLSVSHYAITREKPQDKQSDNLQSSESSRSEPKGQESTKMDFRERFKGGLSRAISRSF